VKPANETDALIPRSAWPEDFPPEPYYDDGPAEEAEPPDARPVLTIGTRTAMANVRTMEQPAAADDWLVKGFMRPGTVVVLASREGVGKSYLRKELEIRGATGRGRLFDYFDIARPLTVATFEEENGPDEEWRRDVRVLAALGLRRDDLADRMHRLSHAGLDLTNPRDQTYIRTEAARVGADLAIFDTGGAMIGDEWGAPMKAAMRFLHSLPCTALVTVHLTKPAREGRTKAGPPTSASITDVMGQWTRSADVVALVSDLGGGRIRMQVRKRAPHVDLTLVQDDGLWKVVAADEGEVEPGADLRLMRAIQAGISNPERLATAAGVSTRTVYRIARELREVGHLDKHSYRLTAAGLEAIS